MTTNRTPKKQKDSSKSDENQVSKSIDRWRKEANKLNYEDSMKKLDLILNNLQADNLQVEDLNEYYLRGQIYLKRCEILLNQIEQEVPESTNQDENPQIDSEATSSSNPSNKS